MNGGPVYVALSTTMLTSLHVTNVIVCSDQKWWCSLCDVGFEYKSKLERHEESAKHRALVTLQQSNFVPAEDDGGVCPTLEDVLTDTTDTRKVPIIWPNFLYTG